MLVLNRGIKKFLITFAIAIVASLLMFFVCIMCNSAYAKTNDNQATYESSPSVSTDEFKNNKLVWTISPKLNSEYKIIPKNGNYTDLMPLIPCDPKTTGANLADDVYQWKFEFDSDSAKSEDFHLINCCTFKNITITESIETDGDDSLYSNVDISKHNDSDAYGNTDISSNKSNNIYYANVAEGYNKDKQQLNAQCNDDGTFSFFVLVTDQSSGITRKLFLTVILNDGEVLEGKHLRFCEWNNEGSNDERKFLLTPLDYSISTLRPNIKNEVNSTRASVTGLYKPFTLMQFSDWHAIPESTSAAQEKKCIIWRQRQNLARMYEYINSFDSPYVDEMLFSGDMVSTGLKEDEESQKKFVNSMWFVNSSSNLKYSGTNSSGKSFTPNNTLPTLGNHDVCIKRPGETTGKVEYTQQQLFDYFVGNHYKEMQLQGIDTSNPHVYYYKDYPDQNLRLITLDSLVKENPQPDITGDEARTFKEQLVWLKEVLQDSAKNNISVVINSHCVPKQTKIEKGWWAFTPTQERTDICDDPTNGLSEKIMEVVQQFMDGSGEFQGLNKGIFAGYLGGHCHFARVVHSTNPKYSNQMFYLVGNANRKVRKDSRDVVAENYQTCVSSECGSDVYSECESDDDTYVDVDDLYPKEYDNFCFVTFDTNNYEIIIKNAGRDTKSDGTYKFCSYPTHNEDTYDFPTASTFDDSFFYYYVALFLLSFGFVLCAALGRLHIKK